MRGTRRDRQPKSSGQFDNGAVRSRHRGALKWTQACNIALALVRRCVTRRCGQFTARILASAVVVAGTVAMVLPIPAFAATSSAGHSSPELQQIAKGRFVSDFLQVTSVSGDTFRAVPERFTLAEDGHVQSALPRGLSSSAVTIEQDPGTESDLPASGVVSGMGVLVQGYQRGQTIQAVYVADLALAKRVSGHSELLAREPRRDTITHWRAARNLGLRYEPQAGSLPIHGKW
ncbi:MAG: hypothetical protein OWT27_07470, partial [Firmicutes bacterium]|nr:hypothetical protein [Bacillota bacterium]